MANESPAQLARDAKHAIDLLKQDVELFKKQFEGLKLLQFRERVAILTREGDALRKEVAAASKLRETNAVLEEKVARLEKVAEEAKQLPVILDRLNKLERDKDESTRRAANFVYAVIGIALGVVGNLIVSAFKKS